MQAEVVDIDDEAERCAQQGDYQKTWRPSSIVKMRSSFSELSSTSQ
jgi:hypothetical protein